MPSQRTPPDCVSLRARRVAANGKMVQATLQYAEALRTDEVRGLFFDELRALLAAEEGDAGGG